MILYWSHSFLCFILWQRLIHFVFTCSWLLLNQLDLSDFLFVKKIFSWVKLIICLFVKNHEKWFFSIAITLCLLKMRFPLYNCFFPSIFVIEFISLCELLIDFLRNVSEIRWICSRLFLIWSIFFEFEFFLDVFEILLIHMWKQIIWFFIIIPGELRRGTFDFGFRTLSNF